MEFLRSFHPLHISRKIYGLIKRRTKPPIQKEEEEEEEELQSGDDSSLSPSYKLPLDLIADKIFSKLCIADQIRTRSVCKWWKSAKVTRCRDEAPWLIMPEKGDFLPSEIRLKSTLENRIYRFQLPRELSSRKRRIGREDDCRCWCCCGSSDGWMLLAVGGDLVDVEMVLWNPLSGEIKNLPSPSTLFFFCRFIRLGLKRKMAMSAIIRCARVLSSSSCSSLVVAIVLSQPYVFVTDDGNYGEPSEQLALCCTDSHDPWWRPVGGVKPHLFYQDICFHKGKLYALCRGDDFSTRTVSETCKYKKVACDVVLLSIRYDWPPIEEGSPMGVRVLERESRSRGHLVECWLTGELLVVTKVKDTFSYRATNQEDDDNDPLGNYFCCTQTRRFDIRRLGPLNDNNNYSLEKMMMDGDGGIGEQGVFLGQVGTVSLRNGVDGVVAHRIAFATKDSFLFVEKNGLRGQRFYDGQVERVGRKFHVFEQGVYDVRDGTMQTQSRINARLYSGSVTGWFTPKLFKRKGEEAML